MPKLFTSKCTIRGNSKRPQVEQYQPTTPLLQYISGETHRYLGRQYRLKITEVREEAIKLTRGYLRVSTSEKTDTGCVKRLLDGWYYIQAQRVVREERVWKFNIVSVAGDTLESSASMSAQCSDQYLFRLITVMWPALLGRRYSSC